MMSVNCQQQILLIPVSMSQYEFIIHINIVNNCDCFNVIAVLIVVFKKYLLFHALNILPHTASWTKKKLTKTIIRKI